jgi:hypothetical protein
MPPNKIKVGFLIDSFLVPAWVHETFKRITESNYAFAAIVIKKEGGTSTFKGFNYLTYNLYGKISRKYTKVRPKAFLKKNAAALFENVPVLDVKATLQNGSLHLQEYDINTIKGYGLDVLIKFGFDKLGGSVLNVATCGVWIFDNEKIFGSAGTNAGVWEVIKGNCATAIRLRMLTGTEPDRVLYQSFSTTGVSISKCQGLACWKAVSFIPRRLKELHELGRETFLQHIGDYNKEISIKEQPANPPANGKFIAYLFSRYSKWLGRKIWGLRNQEQWLLLYHFNDQNKLPDLSVTDFKYREIIPPSSKFWADPCVLKNSDGQYFIFFEEYVYSKKRAHLSVLEIAKDGTISKPQIVLEKPYHLSYPFILKEGNDLYMIPETSENKTIELYKCVSFPDKWEFQMNLMENIHAVDTTLHFYNSKYWLFVNIKENKGGSAWDELFLFSADNLLTQDWKPHPQNPIISDVRQSRPAGHLIEHEGKLYRPSQDCSCSYGYATNMNEIITLNEKEYQEKTVTKLLPKWNSKAAAVHTLSYREGLAVLDARYKSKK